MSKLPKKDPKEVLATPKKDGRDNAFGAGELINEGERLARPVVLLRPRGARYAGIWGGPGIIPTRSSDTHLCTIDLKRVPGLGLSGCLSVYVDDDQGGVAVHDPKLRLPKPTATGKALFAESAMPLPWIDVVLAKGGRRVRAWHRANDGPDAEIVEKYERAQQEQHPLYSKGVWAMLGGWPMLWPEDDKTWEQRGRRLVLWTFHGAEPWIEVWRQRSRFIVIQRGT